VNLLLWGLSTGFVLAVRIGLPSPTMITLTQFLFAIAAVLVGFAAVLRQGL
jgi:hypothetical protein